MALDLSLFKNIDFTNTDTLIFLAIIFVIAIIVFFVVFSILSAILRLIKRIIIRIFNLDVKKPKFNQKDTEWLHKQKATKGPDVTINPQIVKEHQKMEMPLPTAPSRASALSEETRPSVKPVQVSGMTQNKKSTIGYGFISQPAMPKPTENEPVRQEIRIPRSGTGGGIGGGGFDMGASIPELKQEKSAPKQSPTDSSMFGGKPEISRKSLEHELRYDAKAWKAQREVGLNLSPAERAKLVKDVFAPVYGQNISKSDLRLSVDKLNRKLVGTKNPAEHAKIRKEIKFFKKIGGIK